MNYFESQGFRQDRAHFMSVMERMTKALEKIAEHLAAAEDMRQAQADAAEDRAIMARKGSGYDDAG
jgi:hypothetical protein